MTKAAEPCSLFNEKNERVIAKKCYTEKSSMDITAASGFTTEIIYGNLTSKGEFAMQFISTISVH